VIGAGAAICPKAKHCVHLNIPSQGKHVSSIALDATGFMSDQTRVSWEQSERDLITGFIQV
jgi:hypothetical protein